MTRLRIALAALLLAAAGAAPLAHASQDTPGSADGSGDLSGLHDFDFLVGHWKVHHRKLKDRLAGSRDWVEFEGEMTMRTLLDGHANVDDNLLRVPGGEYRGLSLRAYDAKTAQWAIWWLDGRNPAGALDPPVKGRFRHGVGTFYSNDTLRGKPIRVRYTWSRITPGSARWEQAFSADAGKTWETNWVMRFEKTR
ncbi:hypothetical protein [Luteimonas aquatica]|uniref:hypothetical protein n=1 Tax=Luteimonas aquatica TaxID=450364 RepID=UPI001F59CA5B|nr:hypothetical protein [Luteimonas aquatica]